jgi:hypothetical protein
MREKDQEIYRFYVTVEAQNSMQKSEAAAVTSTISPP